MRTFSREHFEAARQSWLGFGWQWQHYRRLAAERGFIYAPLGSDEDDRDDSEPSQRAILWRALNDNPHQLETIIRRSRSWFEVVAGVIALEDRLRADVIDTERDAAWDRRDDPTHREAVTSLAGILERIDQAR